MKMMNKRGISPLIATVLLIGFAVALAAVVMTWGLDFITDTADTTKKQTEHTLICASDLSFSISNVDQTIPGSESITIDNRGQVDIVSVVFRIHDLAGAVTLVDSSDEDLTEIGVPKFAVKTFLEYTSGALASLQTATKVEAVATVSAGPGEEDIVCPQNIQSYTIT
jgi:flagellin-like protein